MPKKKGYKDQELIAMLHQNDDEAISLIFRQYYPFICKVVLRILKDDKLAEDLAQDVFFELWKKRKKLRITTSLKAYLRRAARNKTLNFIRDQKIKFEQEEQNKEIASTLVNINQKIEGEELKAIIHKTIDNLPERCGLIFSLSRFEEMSYKEIANQLNISVKTVENQISKALKSLRIAVKPYISKGLLLSLLIVIGYITLGI